MLAQVPDKPYFCKISLTILIFNRMKKKTTELILLESGRYMLDMSKLVFGGVILVGIMQIEGLSIQMLLIIGGISVVFSMLVGLVFLQQSQINKRKE